MTRPTAIALSAFLAATVPAAAEMRQLIDPVAGHPGRTWYDLMKIIVPDLTPEGAGSEAVALRYVEDLGDSDEDPRPEGPFIIRSVDASTLEAEGRRLTVLSADLGPADGWAAKVEALAVFDEGLNLLDAINVGQDSFNGIRGNPIRISARDQALLTYSEHFNSNQTYGSYALLMIRDGQWQTIDTISTLSDRWCGHERTQSLNAASSESGPGYWPITVTVTDTQHSSEADDECGGEANGPEFDKTYAVTYTWSASMGLYVASDHGFAALDEENGDRY